MIYWLYPYLEEMWQPFSALRYIGVRSGLAFAISMTLAILLGKPLIARLRAAGVGEDAGFSDDAEVGKAYAASGKAGTPTMGGVFWLSAILLTMLLFCRLDEPLILIGAVLMVGMGTIGFLDDWMKLKREGGRNGMSRRAKMLASLVLAVLVVSAYWALGNPSTGYPAIRNLYFPILKDIFAQPDTLGWWGFGIFVVFQTFVILATSHAANVTDGLDGLAAGSAIPALVALALTSYAVGHLDLASYLNLPHIPGSGEVTVMVAAVLGATFGFLWYNSYPAEVFLGDSGSLPLGASIAYFAIVSKQELALPLLAGVFVLEVSTSLLQIYYYKFTGGKRLFPKAPIHHVWQLRGMPESKIVARFWILSAVCAALGLLLVKLR
ncbi:MAG: phospho-N-acetylmuramoyl-pentapeptide-transferase [Planctomycetota bacterium]